MKMCIAFLVLLLLSQVCAAQNSPTYAGYFDVGNCNQIAGWAADTNRLNTPINVTVFSDLTPVATVLANVSRPDVASAIGGNGLHGFNITLPPPLNDTHAHTVSIRFETTNVELTLSPKTIGPCVTPPEGTGQQVRLEVTLFKINNGAGTTKSHLISLNFDAREVSANGISHEATITEYRVRGVGLNEPLTSIEASPWQPFNGSIPPMGLPERNDSGVRYGARRVLLQVKSAAGLISDVASDTITLEPVLKDYTVHAAADHTHPLIQYAASQGFTFPRTFFQVCQHGKGGSASPDISSGFAQIDGGVLDCPSIPGQADVAARDPKCETRFEYELFGGRQLNKFWHIKSVNVSGADPKFHGVNSYLLKGHVTRPPDCCPAGAISVDGYCVPDTFGSSPTVTIGDIVIEGPEVDDFVNAANPWENAFVQQLIIHPPPPGTRPGFPPHD
jgi:hypothetical protein